MRVLFVNSNLYGHINPTLPLVDVLTKRGNTAKYFCSENFAADVGRVGAEHLSFTEDLDRFLREYRPSDRHPFFLILEYMLRWTEAMLPTVLQELRENSYDAILCDSIFGGAYFLGAITGLPVFCSHSSFALGHAPVPERMLRAGFHPQLDNCYRILARLCSDYGVDAPSLEEVFVSRGDLNVVYTAREFNGDPTLGSDYLFVGPSLGRHENDTDWTAPSDSRPLVYISLGSINTDDAPFFRMCAEAFGDADYNVLLSVGKHVEIADLGTLPSAVLARRFVPQLQVLSKAACFVTHAGFNSVNESLYYGVPMLALPRANDQFSVAKRVTELGLGLSADHAALDSGTLRAAVDQLISDSGIRSACADFSKQMQIDGKQDAVKQMEAYVERRANGT